MNARNRRSVCAYCGREGTVTRDHVPPRALFSKPCPPDMLTVPSCAECNASFKDNDEYTRLAIGLDVRAASHRDVIGNLETIGRSLQRPSAHAFVKYLMSQMTAIPVLGANGRPITKMTRDLRRINATGEHIIRGLFYLEKQRPLRADTRVMVGSQADIAPSDPMLLNAVLIHDYCQDRRKGEVGKAFSYAVGFEGHRSVWIMMLYGFFFWFGLIGDPPEEGWPLEMISSSE